MKMMLLLPPPSHYKNSSHSKQIKTLLNPSKKARAKMKRHFLGKRVIKTVTAWWANHSWSRTSQKTRPTLKVSTTTTTSHFMSSFSRWPATKRISNRTRPPPPFLRTKSIFRMKITVDSSRGKSLWRWRRIHWIRQMVGESPAMWTRWKGQDRALTEPAL